MTGRVAELLNFMSEVEDTKGRAIADMWRRWRPDVKIEEWKELRNYLFATDTSTTSNQTLPWKNRTTVPKLTQIRDNLHSNYISALIPNDNWLRWEGYTLSDEMKEKRVAIESYMKNKTREDNTREVLSQLLYDYIDYGNAFADVEFIKDVKVDEDTGEEIIQYVGPRLIRISPYDIVFNPTAPSFKDSPTITRKIKTIGELKLELEENPEAGYLKEALERSELVRRRWGDFNREDTDKEIGYTVDGFETLWEYYQSNFVEILEFEGDWHDVHGDGDLNRNRLITIIDRNIVLRDVQIPSWLVNTKSHVSWRKRPDNLYGMGPLDNLVGMQYRIDHLENLKADAMDLVVHPPLKIIGEVEEFVWGPGVPINIDEGGSDVVEMGSNLQGIIGADNQIASYEFKMEEFAGAPKQAMGIRTPGEKTAFEVQQLGNAAGRIFTEKVVNFEINLLEPALNAMLESARRNFDTADVVRVMDDEFGVALFISITKEDITARGKLRPIGARHFAQEAQLIQNIQGLFGGTVGQLIAPHISSKQLAKVVEDILGLERFEIVQTNVALFEQAETQRIANQLQEDVAVEQATPLENEEGVQAEIEAEEEVVENDLV